MVFFIYDVQNPKACKGAPEVLEDKKNRLRGTSEVLDD